MDNVCEGDGEHALDGSGDAAHLGFGSSATHAA